MKNKITQWSALPSFVLFLLFAVINLLITEGFFTTSFIGSFFSTNAPLICVSLGCAVVLIGGGMDISLGAIVTLINVIFAKLIEMGLSTSAVIAVCLLLAVLLGAVNGFVIGYMRVTPLLATFATSAIFAGLSLWIMPTPGGSVPEGFADWYNGFFLLPVSLFIVLALFLLCILIYKTPVKYWIYSVGKNELKAYVSGVPVKATKFFMYTFAGFTAGIGAIAISGSIRGGDPMVGLPLSMNSIAACVIGGISLSGGGGTLVGSLFGSMFLMLVTIGVSSANVPSFYQDLVTGIILLVSVVLSILLEKNWSMKAPKTNKAAKEM